MSEHHGQFIKQSEAKPSLKVLNIWSAPSQSCNMASASSLSHPGSLPLRVQRPPVRAPAMVQRDKNANGVSAILKRGTSNTTAAGKVDAKNEMFFVFLFFPKTSELFHFPGPF